MLYYFAQLNLKLLLVIIVFGMIMSKTRQIASQNFSKKASGYYIMDFFNDSHKILLISRTPRRFL